MKKIIFAISIIVALLLSGCSRNATTAGPAYEAEVEIEAEYDWQATIDKLRATVESQEDLIASLEDLAAYNSRQISDLEQQLESVHESAMQFDTAHNWWMSTAQIRQNLVQNSGNLPWEEIFGTGNILYFREDFIFIGDGYVIARAFPEPDAPRAHWFLHEPDLLLTFTTKDGETIDWEIAGHYFIWGSGFNLLPQNWQNRRRHITDAESVTVRFYNVPYLEYPYLAAFYNEEEIPGSQLWEDTIRLMEYHSGIQVWDWWYEGRRIYVDLKPMQWPNFTMGSVSFWVSTRAVLLTFATFPDVDEIEIMFGGNRVELDHHGSFWGHYVIGEGFPLSPYTYNTRIVGG